MKRAACLAFAAAAITACDTVYELTIEINDAGASGFNCTDDAGMLLIERASNYRGTVILDVLDYGSNVDTCRPNEIYNACKTSGCPLLARACYPVVAPPADAATVASSIASALAALQAIDAGIANLPTDRSVIVRLVGTAQLATDGGCPEPLDSQELVGCAYSCPGRLDVNGSIELELDSLQQGCSAELVDICASLGPSAED